MRRRWLRAGLALTTLAALLVAPGPVPAQGPAGRLARLAAATGRRAYDLTLLDEARETLLDGREIVHVKALDGRRGEVVTGAFLGEEMVDAPALRASAGERWRAAHGALTPPLVARLEKMQPEEKLNVALWLAGEIEALPQADVLPVAPATDPSSAGEGRPARQGLPAEAAAKAPARPVPAGQVPAAVRARLVAPPSPRATPIPLSQQDGPRRGPRPRPTTTPTPPAVEEARRHKAENDAALRAQVAPLQARLLERLHGRGLSARYAGELTPAVYLEGVTRAEVEEIARWPEVDAIYPVPETAGPALADARPAQNADLVGNAGYTGAGVSVAVVEGDRAAEGNPYLSIADYYDPDRPAATHTTAVAGIIGSTHQAQRGLAPAATVYSANGDYTDYGLMMAALDWGAQQATVLNNSWYWDFDDNPTFWAVDRQLDYLVRYGLDFVTVAAGNFGGCTGTIASRYVTSPAKGYNVLTVGNVDDRDTPDWEDDIMGSCSSYGDPGGDSAFPVHAKPEVAAVGSGIASTLPASPWVGQAGSGTSYAAPMAAALAADLVQADPRLATRPAALRAILMATALHNVEGSARLSDRDGTGALDASAALATVERGHWAQQTISSTTTFPITYTQKANQGERVRFVISWLSNPDVTCTADALPVDLDLLAYRADGTTRVQASASASNGFEIVDFVAPATEQYQFRVTRPAVWPVGSKSTALGAAWWRGTYRIAPDTPFLDPKATPLGTHLSVYPGDWPVSGYWHAFGIRSQGSDHDLTLSTASWFDNPGERNVLAGSCFASSPVDLTVVDGNHRAASEPEHYRVNLFAGEGGYAVSWSNLGEALGCAGWYGPFTMAADEVVKVFDVEFPAGGVWRISALPVTAAADLGLELFRSDSGEGATWTQGRGQAVAHADAYGPGAEPESLHYANPSPGADWLGLVVYNAVEAPAEFWLYLERFQVYLPFVARP